jgi:hypothetical protein
MHFIIFSGRATVLARQSAETDTGAYAAGVTPSSRWHGLEILEYADVSVL